MTKTYEHNGYRYYYDQSLRLWTIYKIDLIGNQISKEADYFVNKKELIIYHPTLKF